MQTSINPNKVARPFPMNFDFHLGEVNINAEQIHADRFFADDELVFSGHFPSNRILPGVMLIEFALYLGEVYLNSKNDVRRLAKIASATFIAPVFPGRKVQCLCTFMQDANEFLIMKAELRREDVVCAKVKAIYSRRA